MTLFRGFLLVILVALLMTGASFLLRTNTLQLARSESTTSIWPPTATPPTHAESDTSAVELGVKFTSDVDGFIQGIRFYKDPQNTGIHIGSLWSGSGELLAQATFTDETDSGWQQVNFDTPVAIQADTVYVASYHTDVGRYAVDKDYFATSDDNAPLHALQDGENSGNGVFVYSADPVFPTESFQSSNYWVDVVFTMTKQK